MQKGEEWGRVEENPSLVTTLQTCSKLWAVLDNLLELGDGGDTANETDGGEPTPEGVGAVIDAKELEVVNDAGEDQLSTDDDGRGRTGAELGDGQDVDDDKEGTDDSSGPGPPGCLVESCSQICWWTTLDFDQKVDQRRDSTCG